MKRLRLNTPLVLGVLLALVILLAMVVPAVVDFGDYQTATLKFQVNGETVTPPLAPGVNGFPLGTDQAGRDLLPRILVGARLTLAIGLAVLLLRALVAIPLGLVFGWRGGLMARTVKSVTLGFNALPTLILVAMLLGVLRRFVPFSEASWYMAYILVLVAVGLPRLIDQVGDLTRHVKTMPHVEAAVSLGATPWRLVTRHVLPIIRGDLITAMAAEMAWVLIMIGQLAVFSVFVGKMTTHWPAATRPVSVENTPELGVMLSINKDILRYHWWPAVYPAIALGLIIACCQLLADGLRIRWLRRG